MKGLLIVLFIAGVHSGRSQQVFHDPYAQLRNVGDFHSLALSNAIDVYISAGEHNEIAISAGGAEYNNAVRTQVNNGVLNVSFEPHGRQRRHNKKVKLYVAAKSLKKISASGACNLMVSGQLTPEELLISLSGASDFKGGLLAGSLRLVLSGASDVSIAGEADNLIIDASGASRVNGFDFRAKNVVIEASGASDIKIHATDALKAQASGASTIKYSGDGIVTDIKTSGASRISRKED